MIIVGLLITTGIVALVLSSRHPPVYASLKTDLPAPPDFVELFGARTTQPTSVDLESFGLIRGGSKVPAAEEEISIEIPVSRRGCWRLVAQIGGDCDREPATVIQLREDLKIQAADRPFSVGVTEDRAAQLQLVQGGERTHRGAPVVWSLAENAAKTVVQLECEPAMPLTITLLPHQGKALCELGASRYELVVANDAAVSPALSFGRVHGFEAGFSSDRAGIDARGGALTVDEDERALPSSETAAVELVPAGSSAVVVGVTAPTAQGVGNTWLRSPHTAHALEGGEDRVPNLLAQSNGWVVPWITLLLGMLLDASIFLISSRRY